MDWTPQYFKNKAAAHGECVVKCVERILTKVDYPEIGYKRVMGLLQFHKACQRALTADMVSYTRIRNTLKSNVDQSSLFYRDLEEEQSHIPEHKNIRGASTYR